ncbi:MAG: hypothetical protein HZB87_06125, partial [Desulfatitalea sp.]|nr:hypothetical protein [Desulfatitalea sp.]
AANTLFSRRLREMVDDGLPVYAECGGLMYLGEELVQVALGLEIAVAGHGREEKLQPRLVHEHEGVGVQLLQAGQLRIQALGHEIEHEGPHRVVEENGPLVLIQDVEAEADGSFELAADGGPLGKIPGLQEAVVDRRIGLADIEEGRIVEAQQGRLQLFGELVHRKAQGALLQIQDDAGKVLGGLHVHVFVVAVVGQLRPEGHVQGEGHLQSPVHVGMGHHRHGGGQQVAGNGVVHVVPSFALRRINGPGACYRPLRRQGWRRTIDTLGQW